MAKKTKHGGARKTAPRGGSAPSTPQDEFSVQARSAIESGAAGSELVARLQEAFPSLSAEAVLTLLARRLGRDGLPVLEQVARGEDDELAQAALRALPAAGTRAAGETLLALAGEWADGDRTELARSGVRALQAQGIRLELEGEAPRQAGGPAYTLREAWESASDGAGSRQLFARFQDRYGAWYLHPVTWNDQAGVKEAFFSSYGSGLWKNLQERLRNEGVLTAQVPADYARWSVDRARALNEQTGFALENRLDQWDELMGPAPEGYTPPDPGAGFPREELPEPAELGRRIEELLMLPTIDSWGPEPADCKPWLETFRSAVGEEEAGPELVSERMGEQLDEAVRTLVTPERRELFRGRLTDLARKLDWLDRRDPLLTCRMALADTDGVDDPNQSVYYRYMVLNGLTMLAHLLDSGEDPEALRYDPMEPIDTGGGEQEQ
ncbi:MAG: hypothetical protein ACK47B_08495 [Armatimonadota bacterium]